MGVDVYLNSVFDSNFKKCDIEYQQALKERDDLRFVFGEDNSIVRSSQMAVNVSNDKRYSEGYFRDSYNHSSLFFVLGKSWWDDVVPLLNDDGFMEPYNFENFLNLLNGTWDFSNALLSFEDETIESLTTHFKNKRRKLISLINKANVLEEPLMCSI